MLDPGHTFELASLDGDGVQILRFVKRVGDRYPGNEPPAYSGCTTQEVIRALVRRQLYVDGQEHDSANAAVVRCLREALLALEDRAARRRGEAQVLAEETRDVEAIEDLLTCPACGHVACGRHRLLRGG